MATQVGERWWPEKHFERLYGRSSDPWNCTKSAYESLKLERTLGAACEGSPPSPILEIGCGEGLLTAKLGDLGCTVTAIDISATAVERARRRCARHAGVNVLAGDARVGLPPGPFRTVVMSEVLYYLGHGRARRVACAGITKEMQNGSRVVVVGPWPASRTIEKELRADPALCLVREDVHLDRGRSYAITIYERR